jgi:hypothetical protein
MSFGDQWASATVGDNDSTPPECGIYDIALDDASAFTAKSGVDWFVVKLRVCNGAEMGHQWSVLANLTKEGGVKAAKAMSAKIGVPIDEVTGLEDLDRLVKQHIGEYFEVEVVQKGEFRNTYFRDRATGDTPSGDVPADPAPVGAAQTAIDDDDIPFAPSVI